MQAISLWQPWASLIAAGVKPFETRDWAPSRALIGQRIAIHAAKKVDREAVQFTRELLSPDCYPSVAAKLKASLAGMPLDLMAGFGSVAMPVGCIVCTAKLDAAFLLGDFAPGTAMEAASVVRRMTSRSMPLCFTVRCDDFGDYSEGRWAWLLSDVKPVTPTARVIGRQGFFELAPGAEHE